MCGPQVRFCERGPGQPGPLLGDRRRAGEAEHLRVGASEASEGLYAKAGKRRSRLEDAVNSARETLMALRLAGACEHLQPAEVAAAAGDVESVIRVLWVLAYKR